MMYIRESDLAKFKDDADAFIRAALPDQQPAPPAPGR
jgi:hypothetical protein